MARTKTKKPKKPLSKRKVTFERKPKAGTQTLIVVLNSPNGAPRRRAEITWTVGRPFRLKHLTAHRDCGRWELPPGCDLRVYNGENG